MTQHQLQRVLYAIETIASACRVEKDEVVHALTPKVFSYEEADEIIAAL